MVLDRLEGNQAPIIDDITVAADHIGKLKAYHKLLLKWSEKISIISDPLDWPSFWNRHVMDSMQLIPLLKSHLHGGKIADLGSGAGLPGMILSIFEIGNVCLIERDIRKAAFLQAVAAELNLQVQIFADDVRKLQDKYEVIVSRAVASVDYILTLSEHIRNKDSVVVLLKSKKQSERELSEAYKTYDFQAHKHSSISSEEGLVLKLTDIKEVVCLQNSVM
ncbi:MAG: 16S rRNA (guanine(527)-N(7))-methyltransferase RsmG [Proteobacteria bacterium]|nr:16S rRNA (guanine(527)-N(7))-methyltransferase RsmG [Pseudomonadota bacterium]